jgi:hypothetical protein
MNLTPQSKPLKEKRTVFTSRVKNNSRILMPASQNYKLGKGSLKIAKGQWKGLPMFSLTLEERKTCPTSCHHWVDCYGNGMNLAYRISHKGDFLTKLRVELALLNAKYKKGFVIRLHVLGDFYSLEYVNFWEQAMEKYPNMTIFGYSARMGLDKDTDIYEALKALRVKYRYRWFVRFSTNKVGRGIQMYAAKEGFKGDSFPCPEQSGKTKSCLTCMACLSSTKTVTFKTH